MLRLPRATQRRTEEAADESACKPGGPVRTPPAALYDGRHTNADHDASRNDKPDPLANLDDDSLRLSVFSP